MKKTLLKSIALSALACAANWAFAQEAPVNSEANAPTPSVKFYGLIQGNANISDSQRTNGTDMSMQHLRAGTKLKDGIVSGKVEIEYVGNQNTVPSNQGGQGGVAIRQAQMNLDAINIQSGENLYTTTLSLGGIRVGGASFTSPDAANVPSQFGRQDGVYLHQKAVYGQSGSVIVGLGAFNSLMGGIPTKLPQTSIDTTGHTLDIATSYSGWNKGDVLSAESNWGDNSVAGTKPAYMATLNATYNLSSESNVNFQAYAGKQDNAPFQTSFFKSYRDVSHVETSLQYNNSNVFGSKPVIAYANGVSAWYEREQSGNLKDQDFKINQTATLVGVGVAGDTSNSSLTNMLQKGDRLTYAASYTFVESRFGNSGTITGTFPKSDLLANDYTYNLTATNFTANQAAFSVGYGVGDFEAALVAELSQTNGAKFYSNDSGISNTKTSEVHSYLTAVYSF